MKRIVLAYSGGLDTSVILKWLQDDCTYEVITFTADLGQSESIVDVRSKAIAHGAREAIVSDLREEFAVQFVFPMLRAAPLYEGYYLLGTSIARPLIAKHLVSLAQSYAATAIAHGATGKGNDQVRFEMSAYALAPNISIVAPWREWNLKGRGDLEAYARKHKIQVPTTPKDPWSQDSNLLHASYEGGVLEDPWQEPPEHLFRLTKSIANAPEDPEYIEIEFSKGDALSLNGALLSPAELLRTLNVVAGRHGIGRVDMVENRYVGIKSRGIYEAPGATVLLHARRAVESLTLDREVIHQRDALALKYAELIYAGYWFSPEREALQAYFDHVAHSVSGVARLKLHKGTCSIVGRRSVFSLYDKNLATFEATEAFQQNRADGFIKINALRLQAYARLAASGGSSA